MTGSIVLKRIACKKTQPRRQTFGSFNRFQGISKLDSNPNLGTKIKGKTTNLIEQPPVCAMAARPVCVSDGGFVLCHGPVAPRCPLAPRSVMHCLPADGRSPSVSHPTDHDYRLCRLLCLRSLAKSRTVFYHVEEFTLWFTWVYSMRSGSPFRFLFRGALHQHRKCAWNFQNFLRMSGLCLYLCRDLSIKSPVRQCNCSSWLTYQLICSHFIYGLISGMWFGTNKEACKCPYIDNSILG